MNEEYNCFKECLKEFSTDTLALIFMPLASLHPVFVCLSLSSWGLAHLPFPGLEHCYLKEKSTLFPLQNYMCTEQSRLNKLNYPVHSETYAAFWSVMEIRKVRRISFLPSFSSTFLNKQTFFHSSLLPGACHVCSVHVKGKGVSGTGPSLNSFLIESLKKQEEFSMGGN